jgi:hypothetical protein
LLLGLDGMGVLACVRESPGIVGVSPPLSTAAMDDASTDGPAPVPVEGRHPTLEAIGSARPSLGHGGRFDAEVYANDSARQAWAAQEEMPDGAVLAEELFDRRGPAGRALGLFVMIKQNQQWQFSIERAAGTTANSGLCDSCHRDAPRDGVFALEPAPFERGRPAPSRRARPEDADAEAGTESVLDLASRTAAAQVVDAAAETNAHGDGSQ